MLEGLRAKWRQGWALWLRRSLHRPTVRHLAHRWYGSTKVDDLRNWIHEQLGCDWSVRHSVQGGRYEYEVEVCPICRLGRYRNLGGSSPWRWAPLGPPLPSGWVGGMPFPPEGFELPPGMRRVEEVPVDPLEAEILARDLRSRLPRRRRGWRRGERDVVSEISEMVTPVEVPIIPEVPTIQPGAVAILLAEGLACEWTQFGSDSDNVVWYEAKLRAPGWAVVTQVKVRKSPRGFKWTAESTEPPLWVRSRSLEQVRQEWAYRVYNQAHGRAPAGRGVGDG